MRARDVFSPPPSVLDAQADSSSLSASVVGARHLSNDAMIDAIADAYRSIWHRAQRSPHTHLVRLWNGVPGIHDRVDEARDRYMLFNAGRFIAMREWFGAVDLASVAPAASGVGIDGEDFIVHALAMATPGVSIQNPRQTPAAHYSKRYGPLPPCFARATRIDLAERRTLFVSGTAAIVGEESVYANDLAHQVDCTIENLAAVVLAGGGPAASLPLAAYSSLRVYLPRDTDRHAVESKLRPAVRRDVAIEFVAAELCRRELLVEIEGVADWSVA